VSKRNRRAQHGGLAFASLAFLLVACSIEAPDIQLVQGNGTAAPGTAVTSSLEPGAASGVGEGAAAADQAQSATEVASRFGGSCKGKPTDVGVSGDQITLGGTFAVSGPVSNISGPILKGVRSYFNRVNEAGGIYGRRIELKWYDDGWDAQRGKAAIKRLVEQDKVFVLSVAPSSNGLDAARSYLEQQRVPVFGTSGLIESQFQSPMQWPVGTGSKSAARISLVYMRQQHVQNLAVIWLDLLAGRQAMEAFTNGIGPIMGKKSEDFLVNPAGYRVSISEPDFGPVWARVINDTKKWQAAHNQQVTGRPDFVALAIDPTNAIKALQAAENIGFRPRVAWGGSAPLFLDLVPQSTDYAAQTGLLAGTSYYPPVGDFLKRPAVRDYVDTVHRYYGEDVDVKNPYLEGGYAGAALTVEILRRTGPCLTRERAIRVADSISNFSAAGLTPPLTYRTIGDGPGHYGNIRGMTMEVSPQGSWRVRRTFIADPSPGRA
jgi:branched-chain amino acid transport system substrate-binding protein